MTTGTVGSRPSIEATGAVPFADCWIAPEAQRAALRVLRSGWVTTGRETLAFEAEFAEYVGARNAVAVSSCTAALELALRSLRLPAGAPVLTSTMTFCGAVQAIIHAGLRPVLVDVDPWTGMPTPDTTGRAALACGRPAAMVVVHWAGDPVDVADLAAAAGLRPDLVVEDAAHALGTDVGGTPVGADSTACFSFYATKNLPIGEGGLVTTPSTEQAAWLRRARLHGLSSDAWRRYLPGGHWRYDVEEAGLKANMSDLQAAMARAQLRHLPGWQRRRAAIAARYDAGLADVPGVLLPHRPGSAATGRHAWHLYPIQVHESAGIGRDALIDALAEQGIGTSVHFTPVHRLSHFAASALTPSEGLPGADAMFARVLSLPMYPRLTDEQVDRVCAAIHDCMTSTHTEVAR